MATTVVRGSPCFCASLIALEMPVIVPPVPAPATNAEILLRGRSDVSRAYCRQCQSNILMIMRIYPHHDLRVSGVVVRERIVRVGILIEDDGVRYRVSQSLCDSYVWRLVSSESGDTLKTDRCDFQDCPIYKMVSIPFRTTSDGSRCLSPKSVGNEPHTSLIGCSRSPHDLGPQCTQHDFLL